MTLPLTLRVNAEYLRELVAGLVSAADELDAVIEALDELLEDE